MSVNTTKRTVPSNVVPFVAPFREPHASAYKVRVAVNQRLLKECLRRERVEATERLTELFRQAVALEESRHG